MDKLGAFDDKAEVGGNDELHLDEFDDEEMNEESD